MKKIHVCLCVLIALGFVAGCEEFTDIHQEYVEDGEIIYAPKTDSVAFIAGKERILFRFWLYNSPNVETVNLYWNNDLDSLVTQVTPSTGMDSTDIVLPGMDEKSYTFNVHTVDKYGHPSLSATDFGTAYGAIFQSSLTNRRIKSVSITDQGEKSAGTRLPKTWSETRFVMKPMRVPPKL